MPMGWQNMQSLTPSFNISVVRMSEDEEYIFFCGSAGKLDILSWNNASQVYEDHS